MQLRGGHGPLFHHVAALHLKSHLTVHIKSVPGVRTATKLTPTAKCPHSPSQRLLSQGRTLGQAAERAQLLPNSQPSPQPWCCPPIGRQRGINELDQLVSNALERWDIRVCGAPIGIIEIVASELHTKQRARRA